MRTHSDRARVSIALAAFFFASRAAFPQGTDERVNRIVGMAVAGGGAQAFLQRLTDSIGGRVTGSPECRATADLLLQALRDAGLENAHFEEYPLESRWQRGRALGRVVSPIAPPGTNR